MFGIVADILSSVVSILFPIFASYKAIRTSSLAQVAPWLMYWVVLSILLLVESWTYFIIGWFPFYSWIRLFVLSYLVLPQTQGATKIYLEYVEPYLVHHEREIEQFIARTHERAKSAGLQQLYKAIDLFREKVLGLPPTMSVEATAPATTSSNAAYYAQTLLSRFNLPAASASNLAAPASELYSLLSSTLSSTLKSRDTRAGSSSTAESILPGDIASAPRAERERYISSLQERLGHFMSLLDREREGLGTRDGANDHLAYGTSYEFEGHGLRKNRSENSFENIDADDLGISSSLDRDDDGYYGGRRSRRR
ncbi:hypothetical protein VTO42DRAFT_8503 [Malbranchea cinnamomea]